MKKLILLFLLLSYTLSAQTVPFAFWKTASAAPVATDTAITNKDTLIGYFVASDIIDTIGASVNDTTYILPNRAKYLSSIFIDDMWSLTSSRKPVIRDTTYKTLVFDGVDDDMQSSCFGTIAQPITVFVVSKIYKPAATSVLVGGDAQGADNRQQIYVGLADTLYLAASTGVSTSTNAGYDINITTSQFNATRSFLRRNGVQSTDRNPGTKGASYFHLAYASTGGTYPNLTGIFHMSVGIYEVVIYKGLLSPLEISSVEQYLATKYGITLP